MKNFIITRRRALQGAGLMAAAATLPTFRVAFGNLPAEKRFIFYILRGAADGLALVPPMGDPDYKDARGGIALSKDLVLPLDDFFSVHRLMPSFHEMFHAGEAAVVHAVASPYRERSHFDGQNVIETGLAAPARVHEGWMNRLLSLYGDRGAELGLAYGHALPLVAQGPVRVDTWAPSQRGLPDPALLAVLKNIYADDTLFSNTLEGAIRLHGMVNGLPESELPKPKESAMPPRAGGALAMEESMKFTPIEFASGSEVKTVPTKDAMKSSMASIGGLLADPKGPRIATIDHGGWDTHTVQGTYMGLMPFNAGLLDAAFEGLKQGLGAHWKNTVLLVATEFGRTVAGNGTYGTDHGTGFCVMLGGGGINGGKAYGAWPGLAKDKQFQGRDLAPTTDLRSILKAVVTAHLGLPEKDITATVFPGSDAIRPFEGLVRGA